MDIKKSYRKSLVLTGIFLFMLIMQLGTSLINAADAKFYSVDDYVRYTQGGTKALIPYGGGRIFLQIKDISNPDDIKVDSINGHSDNVDHVDNELLKSSMSAGVYILNNISINADLNTRPEQLSAGSILGSRWNDENISIIKEYFMDVERTALEMNFTYSDPDLDGDLCIISCYYLWDRETGILLRRIISFDNIDQPQYSGDFSQTLVETNVWELDTNVGIPGFHLEILIPAMLIGFVIAYFKKRKEWRVV